MTWNWPTRWRRIGAAFEFSNNYIKTRDNQPPGLRRLFHRLPLPLSQRFKRGLAYLDETTYGLIEQRRRSGLDGNDLLSLLLNVRDEEADNPADAVMTDQQVRDEVITLFAAGHETTAVALTWTWYLLATHPDIQARFHAELDTVLGGRAPTTDDLTNLPFTERILTESMRLYPPIWSTGRMTFEPITLGGYQIPAGAALVAPQLINQRDPPLVRRPAGVPARPVDAGVPGAVAPVRLLPLRRRPPPLHRGGLRVDGSAAGTGHPGATLGHAPRPEAQDRAAAPGIAAFPRAECPCIWNGATEGRKIAGPIFDSTDGSG